MNYECIIKTAKDDNGNILWRAIYRNNTKLYENYDFDINKLLKSFAPKGSWKEIVIVENDIYLLLEEHFPEIDDFSFLLDYTDIDVGSYVYLMSGKHRVVDVWGGYRESGNYIHYHWEEIDGEWYSAKYEQFLSGHNVEYFKVDDDDTMYCWDDWNYQQSFLYSKFM